MSETNNGPERRRYLDRLGEYTEIRFQQMRWASKAAKCLDGYEEEGGDRDDIRDGFTLSKLTPEERQAEVRRQMRVNSYMGVTTWTESGQGAFLATFDAPVDELDTLGVGGAPIGSRLSIARAHTDGYNTGRAGGDLSSCTLAAESEEAKAWAVGFADGIEDRKAPKPAKPAKEGAEAAPNGAAKRGRKKKTEERPEVSPEAAAEPMPGEPPPAVH